MLLETELSFRRVPVWHDASCPSPLGERVRVDVASSCETPREWVLVRMLEGATSPWLSMARVPTGYHLRLHNYADFIVDERGTHITCVPATGCSNSTLESLLFDQILPQVLHLRGRPGLHASAVALDGRNVVAFVGRSGAGKSTLAASFVAGLPDARIVSDDCLTLSIEGPDVVVHPSYPSVRLCSDSAEALCVREELTHSERTHKDKWVICFPKPDGKLLLRGLYVLQNADDEPKTHRIGACEAALSLIENLHRLDPDGRPRLEHEFQHLTGLMDRVPVKRLSIPHRYAELDKVHKLVRADIA